MSTAQSIDTDSVDGTPGTVRELFTSRKYRWGRWVERAFERGRRRRSGEFRRAELSSIAAISGRKANKVECAEL